MTITVEQKLSNILRNFHRNTPHPEADADDIEAAIGAIIRAMTPVDTAVILDFERRRLAEVAKDAALYSGCPAEQMADEIRDAVIAAGGEMAAGQRRVSDLLEANNRYLERCRVSEAELRRIKVSLHDAHMAGGMPEEDR